MATSRPPSRRYPGRAPRSLRSVDPRTGRQVGEVAATAPAEVPEIVAAARKVAPEWVALGPRGRVEALKEVRHRIYDRLDGIVDAIALETGKPRAEAIEADVLPAVLLLAYYERVAPRALRPRARGRPAHLLLGIAAKIEWRPYGVVGAITPWNYPFSLTLAAAVPALFAGNAVVLKPSEVTPQVGEVVRDVLEPLPPGVATVIQGAGHVGSALVGAPCDKICFIGSPEIGRRVATAAAKHLTPVVMELGGKDAAIVCSDADLETAAAGILWGSFVNSGQTCAAIERIYVAESVADRFRELLLDKLGRLRVTGPDADVGAISFDPQFETVAEQLRDAIAKGAIVSAGGAHDASVGLWFEPTIVEDVTDDMTIMQQETFGPLVVLVPVADEDDAVARANEDGVNLTASVWTRDRVRARRVAAGVKAGTVSINAHAETFGAPWAPWGGVGGSGYGRVNGIYGLYEFAQPVVVGRNMTPRVKRLWWYPYDSDTEAALAGAARILSARRMAEAARELPGFVRSASAALRNKL